MKKVIIASLAALAIFTIISCSKNDDSKATIEGKWYAQTLKVQIFLNGASVTTIDSTLSGTGYYEFTGGSTFNAKDEEGNVVTGSYTYDGNTKKLVTTDGGAITNYDVTTLTSNNLTLHTSDTTTQSGFTTVNLYDIYLKK